MLSYLIHKRTVHVHYVVRWVIEKEEPGLAGHKYSHIYLFFISTHLLSALSFLSQFSNNDPVSFDYAPVKTLISIAVKLFERAITILSHEEWSEVVCGNE